MAVAAAVAAVVVAVDLAVDTAVALRDRHPVERRHRLDQAPVLGPPPALDPVPVQELAQVRVTSRSSWIPPREKPQRVPVQRVAARRLIS